MSRSCSSEHVTTWLALYRANALLTGRLDAALRAEVGLTLAEHEVLVLAAQSGGRVRMSGLADGLVVSRSGATRLVAKLEEAGLLARETPLDDRRATFAVLTHAGRETLDRSRPVFEATLADAFASHLTPTDVSHLSDALGKLVAANGDQHGRASTLTRAAAASRRG